MAKSGKTVCKHEKEELFCPSGFFPRKPKHRRQTSGCGKSCKAGSRPIAVPGPSYLTLPSLKKVQNVISTTRDIRTPCRILAALDRIFPLKTCLEGKKDFASTLKRCMTKWIESFFPAEILDKLPFKLEICSPEQIDGELYYLPDDNYMIQFGLDSFVNSFFPLGEIIEQYNCMDPLLGKYLLKILSDSPLSIGTPETVYEFISYFCWCGDDNESELLWDRTCEYSNEVNDREEAENLAKETIIVEYAELTESIPEWAFCRKERLNEYHGFVPDELRKLEHQYQQYVRMEKKTGIFPTVCFPAIVAPLDEKSFFFSCDAVDRVSNDQISCGASYAISSLAWAFNPLKQEEIIQALQEIRVTLEYFGGCLDFLLKHEKVFRNA